MQRTNSKRTSSGVFPQSMRVQDVRDDMESELCGMKSWSVTIVSFNDDGASMSTNHESGKCSCELNSSERANKCGGFLDYAHDDGDKLEVSLDVMGGQLIQQSINQSKSNKEGKLSCHDAFHSIHQSSSSPACEMRFPSSIT